MTALLRKSQGTEDNSGDFDQYPDVKTLDTAGIDVTLKGAEGQFTLALWQEDGFSYSLRLSQGQDAQGWAEILSGIRSKHKKRQQRPGLETVRGAAALGPGQLKKENRCGQGISQTWAGCS